jgi:hypothetical protein
MISCRARIRTKHGRRSTLSAAAVVLMWCIAAAAQVTRGTSARRATAVE